MDKIQRIKQEEQYRQYVKQKTPRHNVWLNMLRAFLLGGTICFFGQVIYHYCEFRKLSADDCSAWTSLTLVFASVLLTGTGLYQKLARWGGAGALVPITGFANSVAAPAIEYKKRRPGIRHRMQDLYYCRPGHTVWNFYELGSRTDLLDLGDGCVVTIP